MSPVDYADVQGLLRFGYGRMTNASYMLVRVKNADAAKAWLGRVSSATVGRLRPTVHGG